MDAGEDTSALAFLVHRALRPTQRHLLRLMLKSGETKAVDLARTLNGEGYYVERNAVVMAMLRMKIDGLIERVALRTYRLTTTGTSIAVLAGRI